MRIITLICLTLTLCTTGAFAMEHKPVEKSPSAIVVAAFGSSYPSTLNSLQSIADDIQKAYPNTPVRMAFTSNIIRKIWKKRATDMEFQKANPKVPYYLYSVKNVLGTIADLQDEGYKNIVVQPTHLTHGEEFIDLKAYVDGLSSIKTIKPRWQPFEKIAVGRPLMGTWGAKYSYHDDMHKLAEALKGDVAAAKKAGSDLVYMGHGNDHLSVGLYYEFALLMNQMYPEVKTFVGGVEGHPTLDEVVDAMKAKGSKKAIMKPLMIVAGDHASNDMASDEEDSWKTVLGQNGIKATPILEGLGDNPAVRAMFVSSLTDAAKDAGIEIK